MPLPERVAYVLSGGADAPCLLPGRAGGAAAEALPPCGNALLGCGAAPDPVRFAGPHREVQALPPYPAAGADLPRLGDLPAGQHTGRDREEQVRVGGQARGCRAPVGGIVSHLRPYGRLIAQVAPGFPGVRRRPTVPPQCRRRASRFPAWTSLFAARSRNLLG